MSTSSYDLSTYCADPFLFRPHHVCVFTCTIDILNRTRSTSSSHRVPPTKYMPHLRTLRPLMPFPFYLRIKHLQDVLAVVDQRGRRTGRNGWVVQRYIERPLLVGGRKFDIRLFVLLVADPSTRSWRRRSLVAGKCPRTGSAIDHRINPDESPGIVTGIDRGAGQGTSLRTGSETLPGHDFNQEAGSEHDGVGNHNTPGSEKMDSSGASASAGKTKAGQAPKGGVGPCPVTAWCHRDAYVRMSSVKYSNDPEKVKDRVRLLSYSIFCGQQIIEKYIQ